LNIGGVCHAMYNRGSVILSVTVIFFSCVITGCVAVILSGSGPDGIGAKYFSTSPLIVFGS
jgi:hypothetical protein